MHFTEAQSALLKTWVIKKLEDISDADADVLADYALALVSTEDAEEVARPNTVLNLKDFLPNNAEQFVDELYAAITSKSYDPSHPEIKPAPPVPQVPTGPEGNFLGRMNESRKRPLKRDNDGTFGQNGHMQGDNRPIKQMRRGGRGGLERGGRGPQAPMSAFTPQQFPQPLPIPNASHFPQGLPSFDPNDPIAIMALQQFMSATFPGFPNPASPNNGMPFRPPGAHQRCRDCNQKGFCAAGASCPYDHDNGRFMPLQSLEYDPSNAMLSIAPTKNGKFPAPNDHMRGRGRGSSSWRGGRKRWDLSMLGASRDSGNTSIVVEQIPQDKLEEQSVRNFFSEFGSIEEVTLHADRKLAVLKFETKAEAKAAYESPKAVFDNRFVKVYWYNSGRFEQQHNASVVPEPVMTEDINMQDDEEPIDHAEFAKRQGEAQRKHEDARRQREEAEKQRTRIEEQLRRMEAESRKLRKDLAKKSGEPAPSAAGSPARNGDQDDSEQTKALRAQLAKLEAEAKELGIDPEAPLTNGPDHYSSPPYRGRGGYHGRGRGRGRGYYQPYRGGWAGGAGRGGAVMRLDNRPKTVTVTFANDKTYDANDEALRQFLLFNSMDMAEIAQYPEKDDTALVTFHQRYEGENFMLAAGTQIPHAGKVETSWYAGPPPAGVKAETVPNGTDENGYMHMTTERGSSEAEDREMYDNGVREEQDLDRFA